ncbi:MAG TPA: spore germination protein GerW family protein [Pirellulales bacterium]|nr:spore germination protein GerW family protein [Pirellulales bacterium]
MESTPVKREAGELPSAPTFLERMVEKLGVHARSASAYSEPISKDGVTIVPVAKVRWGFGGGGGAKQGSERGGGGGGGMRVTPVGYIELKDGRSEFKPIRDAASFVPIIVAGGAAGFFLLRALRKLLR